MLKTHAWLTKCALLILFYIISLFIIYFVEVSHATAHLWRRELGNLGKSLPPCHHVGSRVERRLPDTTASATLAEPSYQPQIF